VKRLRGIFERKVKRAIIARGQKPIRAVRDAAGNCIFCGEAGRCPGWHAEKGEA
jgi:radical SAM superfamily enzyme